MELFHLHPLGFCISTATVFLTFQQCLHKMARSRHTLILAPQPTPKKHTLLPHLEMALLAPMTYLRFQEIINHPQIVTRCLHAQFLEICRRLSLGLVRPIHLLIPLYPLQLPQPVINYLHANPLEMYRCLRPLMVRLISLLITPYLLRRVTLLLLLWRLPRSLFPPPINLQLKTLHHPKVFHR